MAEALKRSAGFHMPLAVFERGGSEKPLRIVVLDTAASKTGALSVLKDYYSFVQSLKDNNEWFFIIGVKGLIEEDPDKPTIRVILREDVKKSRIVRLLFDHFTGSGFLRGLKPDVILSLQNTLPAGAEKIAQTEIYLHQPLGFQKIKKFSFFDKWERELAVYQHLIAGEIDRSLKRADRIIVQTKWMKDAVIEKDGIAAGKIDVIPPFVELCQPEDAELCKPIRFIFPAGCILYKNHQCIIDAVGLLVKKGIRDFIVIFTERKENLPWVHVPSECEELTEWRGMIPREELTELYKKSILLFPSYIETFGLPLAEARSLGRPVIAADTPFAREILSGYDKAEFFDPFDPAALAELMTKTQDDKNAG